MAYMYAMFRHSVQVLSTIVGYSIIAMVTYLWRHLTHDLRGTWHTVYTMFRSNGW